MHARPGCTSSLDHDRGRTGSRSSVNERSRPTIASALLIVLLICPPKSCTHLTPPHYVPNLKKEKKSLLHQRHKEVGGKRAEMAKRRAASSCPRAHALRLPPAVVLLYLYFVLSKFHPQRTAINGPAIITTHPQPRSRRHTAPRRPHFCQLILNKLK